MMTEFKKQRFLKQVKQITLTKMTGISNVTISHIENGYFRPGPKIAEKLSKAMGISVEKLFPKGE